MVTFLKDQILIAFRALRVVIAQKKRRAYGKPKKHGTGGPTMLAEIKESCEKVLRELFEASPSVIWQPLAIAMLQATQDICVEYYEKAEEQQQELYKRMLDNLSKLIGCCDEDEQES